MALNVSRSIIDDVVVLQLRGTASYADAVQPFTAEVRQALDEGYRKIILDFARLTYLGSTFLGSLVSAYTALRNTQGEMVIVNAGPQVIALFTATRLKCCFQIFDTLPDALKHFGVERGRAASPSADT